MWLKLPRLLFYTLLAAASATAAFAAWTAYRRVAEDTAWRELTHLVLSQPKPPAGTRISEEGISVQAAPNSDQYGYITLANGEVWRFAFRSHHLLRGPDSFSVFTGPLGTYRVQGSYFCCEVQLIGENNRPPADSAAFLSRLRESHPVVYPVSTP